MGKNVIRLVVISIAVLIAIVLIPLPPFIIIRNYFIRSLPRNGQIDNCVADFVWGKDGKSLYYTKDPSLSGNTNINLYRLDVAKRNRLLIGKFNGFQDISPDGREILVRDRMTRTRGIINLGSNKYREIYKKSGNADFYRSTWLSNGKIILWAESNTMPIISHENNSKVLFINPNTGEQTLRTFPGQSTVEIGIDGKNYFSRDQRLISIHDINSDALLYSFNLPPDGVIHYFGSTKLLYNSRRTWYFIDLINKEQHIIPKFIPSNSRLIGDIKVSPDFKYYACLEEGGGEWYNDTAKNNLSLFKACSPIRR